MIDINSTFESYLKEEHENKSNSFILEDLMIIRYILSQFIPFYGQILLYPKSTVDSKITAINSLISLFDSLSKSKKNKSKIFSENTSDLKFEEKSFLYKAYISSSDTNQTNGRIFQDKTLRLTTITTQMIKSILILIKEELANEDISKYVLLKKLSIVETVVINESKGFDYRNLYIFLHYIILIFCENMKEIIIERIFNNRVDQVETIIKNGVYLEFISKASQVTKIISMNKIECLNENIIFKILYDFIAKKKIDDVSPEQIEISKINIVDILMNKTNIKTMILKKMTIDKIQMIEEIIFILQNNKNLKKLCIDKFISIPDNYLDEILDAIYALTKLFKIKICISSSTARNIKELIMLPCKNPQLKRITLKVNRISLHESEIKEQMVSLSKCNLNKLSLILEQFNLVPSDSLFLKYLPDKLTNLSLGFIDHNALKALNNAITTSNHINLTSLKLYFLPINEEHYDQSYQDIQSLIKHGRIQYMFFYYFVLKYRSIADDELKNILKQNTILRKLVIKSDIPFHIQQLEGYYYYDLPSFLIEPLMFMYKKHPHFQKFYHKKRILSWIIQFFIIKKDKSITINYQV